MCVVYVIVFSGLALWKYWNFGYNALDLAIYSQTLFNSAEGRWFALTIHPHSYLGDHVELLLAVLVPFVRLIPRPETLLVLQAAILASAAFPLFRIARRKLPSLPALGIVALYLLNPILHNIALFEFHALPFAIPLLLWAWDAYERKHFPHFLLFLAISLLVREDVAISAVAFSAFALVHRREKRWVLAPLLASAAWFIVSTQLASSLNGYGNYKFLYYYAWLGETPRAMIETIFTRPLFVLQHFITSQHLFFVGGILLPLLFLPLFRPLPLVGAIFPWAQIALTSAGASLLEIQTHYAALIIPWVFVASIESLSAIHGRAHLRGVRERLRTRVSREPAILWALLGTVAIYSMFTMGPLVTLFSPGISQSADENEARTLTKFIERIPPNASVSASFQALTPLSMRENVYSLHYAFLGQRQLSREPYELPRDVEYLLMDGDDILTYELLYPSTHPKGEQVATGDNRLRELVNGRGFSLLASAGEWTLWKRGNGEPLEIARTLRDAPQPMFTSGESQDGITLLGASPLSDMLEHPYTPDDFLLVPLSLLWKNESAHKKNVHLRFTLRASDGETEWEHLSPLGYGFLPTSEWRAGEIIETRHWLLIPRTSTQEGGKLSLELVEYDGVVSVNSLRSAAHRDVTVTPLGPPLLTLPMTSLVSR